MNKMFDKKLSVLMPKKRCLFLYLLLMLYSNSFAVDKLYTIGNRNITRVLEVKKGVLSTVMIKNRMAGTLIKPMSCNEFELRVSKGTYIDGGDAILTSADFQVTDVKDSIDKKNGKKIIAFHSQSKSKGINLIIYYELGLSDFYLNKYIEVMSENNIVLEKIDIESMVVEDAFQNYTKNEIRTSDGWRPGLGQPIYTTKSATFWGVEFPASSNKVENNKLSCGYFWGNELNKGTIYKTYKSVVGVADNKEYIDDAFYNYIDRIRIRPLRLQIQYNSWFDFGQNVSKKNFEETVEKINMELVEKRGCAPLNAYVIDDGWQDSFNPAVNNWQDTVWKVNSKFDKNFKGSMDFVSSKKSRLGIWLSPGCCFGAKKMLPNLKSYGYEALTNSMSMSGPRYMQKLEDRILELTNAGVSYFKFDGSFGHLLTRDFELDGRGCPAMPQLNLAGFSHSDRRLNDTKYDELKLYYLVAGTERLMKIFSKMAQLNPDIYIAITNGAYLSPWWLQTVDVVWLINAGDAATGSDRSAELVYRDHKYYEIWKTENTKFPMSSIFNHEPKKTSTEQKEAFRDYLYMNLSRGTGFIELYLKTQKLLDADWDVLAEGLKWASSKLAQFKNVKMHGGDPSKNEVYGFSGWTDNAGYLSFHNPSASPQSYSIKLDRKLGLSMSKLKFKVSSPTGFKSDKAIYKNGDTINLTLNPKEIVILDFCVR